MLKKEYFIKVILFSLLYIITAKAGLMFALNDGLATAIWPPSGLALVMLFKFGRRMWPAILIGAFTTNFIQGGSLSAATIIGIGNTLEGLVILQLVKNSGDGLDFTRLRSGIIFILSVFAGTAVSAFAGSFASIVFLGAREIYLETIFTWWFGDGISCLLILPGYFLFSKSSIKELQSTNTLMFFGLLFTACYLILFTNFSQSVNIARASVYTLIVFSLWASIRYNGFIAILTVFTIFTFVLISTLLGKGPYYQSSHLKNDVIIIQVITGILAVTTLIVSVGIREKSIIEQKLKDSLREKDLLLSEIHHRVKNNLAVISSLIYLQGEKIPDLTARQKFNETEGRIRSMSLIHEKLYMNEDFGKVEFSGYIRELTKSIGESYEITGTPIHMDLRIDEHYLEMSKALPCGLILNEILANSYKYAFNGKSRGVVEIDFAKKNRNYLLRIKDNGIGFNVDSEDASQGLGLTLINSLIEQISGTMSLKSDDKGTVFEFYFN